jgi:hypothetical protein
LPAFFFPPLAFFAIVLYPPLHLGLSCANADAPNIWWLPPGTLTRRQRPSLRNAFYVVLVKRDARLERPKNLTRRRVKLSFSTSLGVA